MSAPNSDIAEIVASRRARERELLEYLYRRRFKEGAEVVFASEILHDLYGCTFDTGKMYHSLAAEVAKAARPELYPLLRHLEQAGYIKVSRAIEAWSVWLTLEGIEHVESQYGRDTPDADVKKVAEIIWKVAPFVSTSGGQEGMVTYLRYFGKPYSEDPWWKNCMEELASKILAEVGL